MRVSVVICIYSMARYEALCEAVESIQEQTYDDVELVLVSDGNKAVYERLEADFGGDADVIVHGNEQNLGIGPSRNNGAELASGEVVAFMDDDSTADPTWVEELVSVYEGTDALAVGGKMVGDWVAGRPWFLPEEFDFLVGVTHPGFAEAGEEVRNTFGSNYSFRRDVFEKLAGFDPNVGRKGDQERQAHESEIGARLQREFDRGVVFHPDAIVAHKVFEYRTKLPWLLNRAFMQGYSKRVFETLQPDASGNENESEYLRQLFFTFVPRRLRTLVREPSIAGVVQVGMIVVFTGMVGLGYAYGIVRLR